MAAASTSMAATAVLTSRFPLRSTTHCSALPYLPPRLSSSSAFSTPLKRLSESRRTALLQVKASEESSALDTGELLSDLKEKWDAVENKSTVIVYGCGAIIAVWLASIVVSAINSVPLLPKILELVGLGYTGWFVYRYLLFKERSKKNVEARGKRKWESRNGSKSTARHHIARGVDLDAPTGQIETWHIRHWHPEQGWISPQAEAKYEEMMQLRRENPLETMTDKEILERVIGRQSVRLFGWGRSPSTSKTTDSSENLRRPTYTQLVCTLNQYESRFMELEGTVQTMRQMLVEKNIMLPTPTPHVPSDHGSGPSRPGTMGIDPVPPHPDVAHVHSSSDEFADANSGYDDMC